MRKRLFKTPYLLPVTIGFILFSVSGCDGSRESRKVVAKVGTGAVTLGEYRSALNRLMPSSGQRSKEEVSELKRDLINQLIEEKLILREAEKSGITVGEQELASEMEGIKKEYGEETFKEAIAERYGNIENWKEEIRKKLLLRRVIENYVSTLAGPGEEAARQYYKEHMSEYDTAEQVRARMIVVAAEDDAARIKARLTPKNFADVAKEVSMSPEGKDGGDLGFFARGEMPAEFEAVVFKLKEGEVSPVVKTEYGYHIFFLEARKKKGRLGYAEVRDRIMEKLRLESADAEIGNWLAFLKKNERIEVNEGLL